MNIIPNMQILLFASDNRIMIRPLPDLFMRIYLMNFFGNIHFQVSDHFIEITARFEGCPIAGDLMCHQKQQMNMVWHDDIRMKNDIIFLREQLDIFFYDITICSEINGNIIGRCTCNV